MTDMYGGTDDGCGKTVKIVLCIIIGFFVISLICNACGIEPFASPASVKVEYYYMNGCPACIQFNNTGIWEELQSRYAGRVSFVKYERQSGSVPHSVTRFPTFMIYKNNKHENTFTGIRTVNAMSEWISNHL